MGPIRRGDYTIPRVPRMRGEKGAGFRILTRNTVWCAHALCPDRTAAAESLPLLLECAKIRGPAYLQEMWGFILPDLLKVCN